ncbi:MAG: anti-sigma factor [Lachnospiraceae bacterium]|nr:anti-sigma factor [Lachnospiraceae bacterium]
MKRDFELEFKDLKLNEVPDLWSRIEAGLSEKNPAAPVLANGKGTSNAYKSAKRPAWRRWGTLAAACLCIAVILPAISLVIGNIGGRKNNYSGSASPAADNGLSGIAGSDADASADAAVGSNMTPASEMMTNEEEELNSNMIAEAEASDMEENVVRSESEGTMDTQDNSKREQASANADSADSVNDSAASKDMQEEYKQMSDAASNDLSEVLENGQVLNGVVIEIIQGSVSGKEVTYKAVVKQQDDNGFLNDGMEISIICNADTQYDFYVSSRTKKALKAKESYAVSLRYEEIDDTETNNDGSVQTSDAFENGRFVVISAN